MSVEIRLTIVHEPTPTPEQVRQRLGILHLGLEYLGERSRDDFTRMIRFLGGPIPERRAQAVRHGGHLVLLERLREGRHGYRPPDPHRKREPVAAGERPRCIKDLQHTAAKRDPVLSFRIHPCGRDRPHRALGVDLIPPRQPDLAAVSTTNLNASLTAGCPDFDAPTVSMAASTFL